MKAEFSSKIFSLVEEAPGYLFITDSSAKILYSNHTISERTGFSRAEAIGKNPGVLWGGKMPHSFYQQLWEQISDKHESFSSTATNQRKNGERYQEKLYILPIEDKTETIQYFLGFQPILENSSDQDIFEKMFEGGPRLARNNGGLFVESLFKWISPHSSLTFGEDDSTLASDIFFETLIAPTSEKYGARTRDHLLISNAQADSQKFDVLYTTYRADVLQYFLKRLGYNKSLAEDFCQETFLKAFSHLSRFSASNASYQTYLLRIAHNILVNHYRKTSPALWDEKLMMDVPAPSHIDELSTKINLESAFKHLSFDDQKILIFMYYQGLSIKEIAEKLKKSENAVKLQVSRARRKLLPFVSSK